jgi:DNA (cytosine-5)-methyltransferase 1
MPGEGSRALSNGGGGMTVGSLFAGIGGFDLGFERAGFDVRWQVEIDAYASRVLAKHWPDVTGYGDIRIIDWDTVEPVDVICGGFPCQPHSTAGRRLASADERDLWGEFLRAIRGVQPRWVVAENVSGLLSSESGRFFGRVLGDLAESGYDAEWDCIPASAVGAPHRRDRVWIIAYPHDGRQRQLLQPVSELGSGIAADARRDGEAWVMAYSNASGWRTSGPSEAQAGTAIRFIASGPEMADANIEGLEGRHSGIVRKRAGERAARARGASVFTVGPVAQWEPEPNVGRVAHGVPARVDRLRGLGNAIVPQIAQWIAERIKDAEVA